MTFNLLNDGQNTYVYDSANRLTSVNGTTLYTYNGLGDRLSQTVGAQTTNYTLDLNTGLTQVLDDGTNSYTYGLGRISQKHASATEYFLGDALGSVRQLTDTAGAVTFAKSYDPYGMVTQSAGSGQSSYGFTGEQQSNDMVYLRARYYNVNDGRFMSRDTWSGDANRPLFLNRWNYAISNPVNLTDPSGNSVYSGICMGQVFTNGFALNMTAQRLVDHCKNFYSQKYWRNFGVAGIGPFDCRLETRWSKPTSAGELFKDYICETGSDHVKFYGNDELTAKLARSKILNKIRREYYSGTGKYPYEEKFGSISGYVKEWADLIVDHEFPLVHVIGSFDVSVTAASGNRVRFWAHNRTDLGSGTHFIGRFPPQGQGDNPLTLEEIIDNDQSVGDQPAWWVINTYNDDERGKIVAILKPQLRVNTPQGMGGGNYEQTFTWTEKDIHCEIQYLPWPVYLLISGIGVDYKEIAR